MFSRTPPHMVSLYLHRPDMLDNEILGMLPIPFGMNIASQIATT